MQANVSVHAYNMKQT